MKNKTLNRVLVGPLQFYWSSCLQYCISNFALKLASTFYALDQKWIRFLFTFLESPTGNTHTRLMSSFQFTHSLQKERIKYFLKYVHVHSCYKISSWKGQVVNLVHSLFYQIKAKLIFCAVLITLYWAKLFCLTV